MRHARNAGENGFTLIEVMAGMIIMTIGVMGLSAAFVQTMTIEETNDELNMAVNAARGRMELIKKMGYDAVVTAYPSGGSFDVAGLDLAGGAAYPGTITISSTSTYVDVVVAVNWTSPSGDFSTSTNARVRR